MKTKQQLAVEIEAQKNMTTLRLKRDKEIRARKADMNTYEGTKRVNAKLMCKYDFNKLIGLEGDDNADGYLVEYIGTKANTKHYENYISWSPKDVFEAFYFRISDK